MNGILPKQRSLLDMLPRRCKSCGSLFIPPRIYGGCTDVFDMSGKYCKKRLEGDLTKLKHALSLKSRL